MISLSVRSFVFYAFVVASCFSYVSFSLNSMDTQVWHLFLVPLCLVFVLSRRVWEYSLPETTFIILTLFFLFFSGFGFIELRSFGSYLSFFSSVLVTFGVFRYRGVTGLYFIFCWVSLVYFIIGLAQLIFGKFIFEFFVHVRTTPDRGVTSLAAEPSYFASIVIILSWLILLCSNYMPGRLGKLAIFLNILSIVVLAQSPLGIVYVALGAVLILFSRLSLKRFVLVAFIGLILFFFFLLFDSRVSSLVFLYQKEGLFGLLIHDASINVRIANVIIPLYISFENLLVPFFYGHYSSVSLEYAGIFNELFWHRSVGGERIMSFIGNVIFELGFCSILYFVFVVSRAFHLCSNKVRKTKELFFLVCFLISAVPVAMPLVGILFAAVMYLGKRDRRFFSRLNGGF